MFYTIEFLIRILPAVYIQACLDQRRSYAFQIDDEALVELQVVEVVVALLDEHAVGNDSRLVLQVLLLPARPVELHVGLLNVVVAHVIDHGVKLHFQPTCNLTWRCLFGHFN